MKDTAQVLIGSLFPPEDPTDTQTLRVGRVETSLVIPYARQRTETDSPTLPDAKNRKSNLYILHLDSSLLGCFCCYEQTSSAVDFRCWTARTREDRKGIF